MVADTTMVVRGCAFCDGTLPTIRLSTTQLGGDNVRMCICRACILVALKEIENPSEYPAVIEARDCDLSVISQGQDS
jgi:hypothetical protein